MSNEKPVEPRGRRFVAVGSVEDRFWTRVQKTPDCWHWIGYKNRAGYGTFSPKSGQKWVAHRYAYELMVGAIPEGMTLDHLCHTESDCAGGDTCPHRACVNPDHLSPMSMKQNVLSSTNAPTAVNARRTECIHGHPLHGDNLGVWPNGHRYCKTCRRTRDLAAYHAGKKKRSKSNG